MANESNYIGIAMGLDVEDLKQGLTEASKRIGEANADFKATSSTMEDWQKSTDGLSAKVKQLDAVLAAQKSKLSGLAAEYEKVAAEQGENSTAARNLYIRMQNQQAVVNSTERELNNYKETLKQAEEGTIDLTQVTLKAGKAVQDAGKEAEAAGGKFGGFVAAIGGGLAAVGGLVAGAVTGFFSLAESTREVRENFARLDTSFESAGHSAETASETYNKLYGVLGDTGRATEAAQQLAKMSKDEADLAANTKILTGVMAEYGDSIPTEGLAEGMAATAAMGEVQGVLADALEWQGVNLEDYNAQLATMATEEERAAFIQKTLTDIYADSADAFEERNKNIIEAREAEAELSKVTAELGAIAEPIMTTLKLLAVDLLEAIKPFVELMGNGLAEAFKGSADGASMLAEGIGGIINMLVERFTNLVPTILEIILQLVPTIVNSLLQQLPEILNLIVDLSIQVINMVTKILPQIVDAIMEILPELINELIKAIPQLLEAAVQLLMAIVEAIPTIIKALVKALPDIISTIISTLLANLPMIINAAIQLFMGIIKAIPQIQLELMKALPQIIRGIVSGLINGIPEMVKAGKDMLAGLLKGLVDTKAIGKAIKNLGSSIVKGFKSFFGIHSPSRLMEDEIGKFLGLGIGEGVIDSIPQVKQQLNKFSNFVTDNMSGIKTGLNGGLASGGRGNTVINAGQTIYFNGNLSRKQIRQLENDNYTSIKMKLRTEGLV